MLVSCKHKKYLVTTVLLFLMRQSIGGPIQCVVSYRDQIYVNNTLSLATDLYMKLYTELGRLCIEYEI